jgi:hypothetical protein
MDGDCAYRGFILQEEKVSRGAPFHGLVDPQTFRSWPWHQKWLNVFGPRYNVISICAALQKVHMYNFCNTNFRVRHFLFYLIQFLFIIVTKI